MTATEIARLTAEGDARFRAIMEPALRRYLDELARRCAERAADIMLERGLITQDEHSALCRDGQSRRDD